MSEMRVMGLEGDTKIIWDAEKRAEVEAAEEAFKKLKKKGYLAYSVKRDGEKGQVITEFDPSAEKIILAPPIAGG